MPAARDGEEVFAAAGACLERQPILKATTFLDRPPERGALERKSASYAENGREGGCCFALSVSKLRVAAQGPHVKSGARNDGEDADHRGGDEAAVREEGAGIGHGVSP
jgi:hypothetical protein